MCSVHDLVCTCIATTIHTQIPCSYCCCSKLSKQRDFKLCKYCILLSGGQKQKMGFTGPKSRCWQGYDPSGSSREESVYLSVNAHIP